LGLLPLAMYSANWFMLSIGPPPDWGIDMNARSAVTGAQKCRCSAA
jgi:hypothetical protein